MENNSVTTNLNISNDDIVTMLIYEKKEQLQTQCNELNDEKIELISPYLEDVKNKLSEFYLSKEFLEFKENLYNFYKLYNPVIDIELKLDNKVENHLLNILYHNYSLENLSLSPNLLYLNSINEENEENLIDPFIDEIKYPDHLNKKFKVNVSKEDLKKYNHLVSEINLLQRQIRDTNGLKEQMVAIMTKKAIMDNPALLAIKAEVLKISE